MLLEMKHPLRVNGRVRDTEGVTSMPPKPRSLMDRLVEKFEIADDGCWNWTATKNHLGYGQIGRGGRGEGLILAHRASYELSVGHVPEGLVLDHLCRNPSCVNPDHLEPVTQAENLRRAREHLPERTHCGDGHELTPENSYTQERTGRVFCRICDRRRGAEYRLRLHAGRR